MNICYSSFSYLWVTERSIQRLYDEVLRPFVSEAKKELNDVVGWEV